MADLNHTIPAKAAVILASAEKMGDTEKHELLVAEPEVRTKRPPFYRVVLLNDDFTPMDFVVYVLKSLFHKPHEEAISIMLKVHNQGAGVCGVYTRDVAETKVEQVIGAARQHDHPLKCVMEKE